MGCLDDLSTLRPRSYLATLRLVLGDKDLEKLMARLLNFQDLFCADFLDIVYETDPCER